MRGTAMYLRLIFLMFFFNLAGIALTQQVKAWFRDYIFS